MSQYQLRSAFGRPPFPKISKRIPEADRTGKAQVSPRGGSFRAGRSFAEASSPSLRASAQDEDLKEEVGVAHSTSKSLLKEFLGGKELRIGRS